MRLIPGIAISAAVLSGIDTNGDGVISNAEQRAYADRVLRDLSLSVDGHRLQPQLLKVDFPKLEELKEGLGEIRIEFAAAMRPGGASRQIVFENHHEPRLSAYLVNCLVPADRSLQVVAQHRNSNQSFYQVDFVQSGERPATVLWQWWSSLRGSLSDAGNLPSTFRLGMRHIAEGTDHLLFLLVLLLPAPLLVVRSQWAGFAGVRQSLQQILQVVTAFTIGHSVTLALAAFGVVRVPTRAVEVLIAISILVSAVHALRPLFPGREAAIAAAFGLMHGLAFATTLHSLGLQWWDRVRGILGFNLGIETMQLFVVCAAMPSLVLLSRTPAYSILRIGGALFAALASAGWLVERLWNVHTSISFLVESVAQRAPQVAEILFAISLLYWVSRTLPVKRERPASTHPTV